MPVFGRTAKLQPALATRRYQVAPAHVWKTMAAWSASTLRRSASQDAAQPAGGADSGAERAAVARQSPTWSRSDSYFQAQQAEPAHDGKVEAGGSSWHDGTEALGAMAKGVAEQRDEKCKSSTEAKRRICIARSEGLQMLAGCFGDDGGPGRMLEGENTRECLVLARERCCYIGRQQTMTPKQGKDGTSIVPLRLMADHATAGLWMLVGCSRLRKLRPGAVPSSVCSPQPQPLVP